MLKTTQKKSKISKLSLFQKASLIFFVIIVILITGFAVLWTSNPYLRAKVLLSPQDAATKPVYNVQRAAEQLSASPKTPSQRLNYDSPGLIQRIYKPVRGDCAECFDRYNFSNGPDQFYFAARTRFHQRKIEEGIEYSKLAAKLGHPSSIHNLAMIYDAGIPGKESHREAYLYFKLLSIYANKFELKPFFDYSEKAIARLEVNLSHEDLDWVRTQVPKLNKH